MAINDKYKDPKLRLTFTRYNKTWYIEWHVTESNRAPVARRKAHDTEVQLIERVRELELLLGKRNREAAELNLKRIEAKEMDL
jgi:hypothetical protein